MTLFLPFAAGYFLSYLFRTVNAVIAEDLARGTGVDAAGLGFLTSVYFVTFAAVQLPLGILLDRYGPRRVEAALLVVAAAGAALFSIADGLAGLTVARGLIGIGVASCLMGAFKNTALWWPKERLPLINGLILAFGGLGALFATTPVAALLQITDWRGIFQGLAGLTLLSAAYIFLAVPEPPGGHGRAGSLAAQFRGVAEIFSSRRFWSLAPVSLLVQAVFMSYQGLWAAAWLGEVHGFDRGAVAGHLQTMAIATITGNLAIGWLTARLARLGIRPTAVAAAFLFLFVVNQGVLLVPGVGWPMVQWALFGFLATAGALTYAILTQAFPPELAGRVNTALNLLCFIAAFVLQAGIGLMLDAFAGIASPAIGHRTTMAVLFALTLASFAWFVWSERRAGKAPAPPSP